MWALLPAALAFGYYFVAKKRADAAQREADEAMEAYKQAEEAARKANAIAAAYQR